MSDDESGCVASVLCAIVIMLLVYGGMSWSHAADQRDMLCHHIYTVEARSAADTVHLFNTMPCAMPVPPQQ
jgi:hypothetical protein